MSDPHHRILVVEDDDATSRHLVAFVRSLGMTPRVCATLEEVERALTAEYFCCVLLDKQLPAAVGLPPLTATGDTVQRRLRAIDGRRNAGDHHILPILVITGAARDLERAREAAFISKNFRDGASVYIPKPFDADTVTGEILAALERAGRTDHAACAALRPPGWVSRPTDAPEVAPGPAAEPLVRVLLDGVRAGRRLTFLVNGKRRDLPDAFLATFLRLAAERARGSMGALPAWELGIKRAPEIPSRINKEVAGAVPEGFLIVQRMEGGMYRLHPLVAVDAIDWEVFERYPSPVVQAVAAGERKRR